MSTINSTATAPAEPGQQDEQHERPMTTTELDTTSGYWQAPEGPAATRKEGAHPMSAAENTAVVRRAMEESVERENRAVVDEVSAPAVDGPASAAPGRRSPEGAKQFATMLRAALFHH